MHTNKHKSIKIHIDSQDQLPIAAKQILDYIGDIKIVLLYGGLGAGKTSLTQEIASLLGISGSTSSPTYTLINEYQGTQGTMYHMDLYRIHDLDEALNIGIEDYLFSGNYCFVEWPDLIHILVEEESYVELYISVLEDNSRAITLTKY